MYKEYDYIIAEYKGYKGVIYRDNMFCMEFCNSSVYDKDGKEIYHATLNSDKAYTEEDVIDQIKWVIKNKKLPQFYYLRKIEKNNDRALYKHSWYNRFYRSAFPTPNNKSFRLYTTKRLSTILKQRKCLHDYCNEWFDVYNQDNNKVEIEQGEEV